MCPVHSDGEIAEEEIVKYLDGRLAQLLATTFACPWCHAVHHDAGEARAHIITHAGDILRRYAFILAGHFAAQVPLATGKE